MAKDYVEVAIDDGTSKWCATAVRIADGKRVGNPEPLLIRGDYKEVPQIATWIGDHFVQGHELREMAQTEKNLDIIHHPKLCLYNSARTSGLQKEVNATLQRLNKTYHDLLVAHYAAVWADCKDAIRADSGYDLYVDKEKLEEMLKDAKIRWTVPQIWTPVAKRQMLAAAREAGLPSIVIAYEPRCALSFMVHQLSGKSRYIEQKKMAGKIGASFDLGAGTTDYSLYEMTDDLGPSSRLNSIKDVSGELCGSYQIDCSLYDTLLARPKAKSWLVDCITKLNVTEHEFKRRALSTIEKIKVEFSKGEEYGSGTVIGANGELIAIRFTKQEIIDPFNEPIEMIISKGEQLIGRHNVSIIWLSGGLAKSWYVRQRLQEHWKHVQFIQPQNTADNHPVAMGALIRYKSIELQSLSSEQGFALLFDEVLEEGFHPDAVGKPWLKSSAYDPGVDVVEDRILNIVTKGTILGSGKIKKVNCLLEFRIPLDDPKISGEFVYLTVDNISDHGPSRKHGEEWKNRKKLKGERLFRAGVFPWCRVDIPLSRSELVKAGFPIVESKDRTKHIYLEVQVIVQATCNDMRVGFEILEPRAHQDEDTNMEGDDENKQKCDRKIWDTKWDTFWDGAYSEFAQL